MMIERFLQYSMEHTHPIRILIQDEKQEKMRFLNVVVVSWTEDEVFYIQPRKTEMGKPPKSLKRSSILSADYVRGDHGDTLQFSSSGD